MNLAIIIFFVAVKVQNVHNTRSPYGLVVLAKQEFDIYNLLDENLEILKKRIPLVEEYLADFKESSLKARADHNKKEAVEVTISKNPIISYRMVRRYATMLRVIHKEMLTDGNEDFLNKLTNGRTTDEVLLQWPSIPDPGDTMEALLRIHHVYDINLEQFTYGNILGTETHVELNAKHCQEIGEYAIQRKQFTSGIEWLEMALNKTDKPFESSNDILKSLQIATEEHDAEWSNKKPGDYYFFQDKLNETTKWNRKSLRKVAVVQNTRMEEETHYCDEVTYWGLCSGTYHQVNQPNPQLFCRYERKSNAAWAINPLKIEQLSILPYVVQIYDVLSNTNINEIKKIGPKLEQTSRLNLNFIHIIRDQVSEWLDHNVFTRSLSRKIELMTGLSVVPPTSGEKFYVTSYAFGGQAGCHLDFLQQLDAFEDGNRLATMMFYLEDVEIGGFTVFPKLRAAAKPIKGSAVSWYNIHRNGKIDDRNYHCACPVVFGQKWITVKAIRANAQLWSRPCSLNPNE